MSQAEELLNTLTEDSTRTVDPATEEHIVIDADRYISVPKPLQRIAVQYDHNIETVTFDCPRYWDNNDLSTMYIYINFQRKDGFKGACLAKNVVVDETDENIIHFEWIIGNEVTMANGELKFLVCAIQTNEAGAEELHWNSEINEEMTISNGLEAEEVVLDTYPSIITDLLTRMDSLKGSDLIIDSSLSQSGFAADAAVVGEQLNDAKSRLTDIETNFAEKETDPTVPDWAKQPTKPIYNHNELEDGDTLAIKDGTLQTNLNSEKLGGVTLEQIQSRFDLVQKYNIPEISLPQAEAVDDLMTGTWTTITTNSEYTNGEKTVKVVMSGIELRKNNFDKVFDTDINSFVYAFCSVQGAYIDFIFDFGKKFKGTFTARGGKSGGSVDVLLMKLYGSHDNEEWIPINENTVFDGHYYDYGGYISTYANTSITSDNYYRYFKLRFQLKSGYAAYGYAISNLYITGANIYTREYNTFVLSNFLPEYRQNDRVMLDVPVTNDGTEDIVEYGSGNCININNLGEKDITGNIEANKKYELVYNGTTFDAKEV